MITISGVVSGFGGSNGTGDKFQEKIPSFSDNVTLIHGGHTFKLGVGFQKNNDTQLADVYTQFTFATLADYTAAKTGVNPKSYSSVTASIGRPGAGYQTVFYDLFAQDTWQISSKLTANYGVRYDQYRAPGGIANAPLAETQKFRTPMGNFAPRVGLAYTPHEGMVVRLSGGMFYEATPTNSFYNPLYSNGLTNTGNLIATLGPTATGAPSFPNTFANVPVASLPTPTPYALTARFKNEYTWNANAQVEQALGKSDALTIGYIMTNGRNLQFLRNSNVIPSTVLAPLADGRPRFDTTVSAATRYNTAFNAIKYIDIGANSSYSALVTNFTHRVAGGLTVNASYTWSHAIADAPEGNSYENSNFIEDPTNRKRDRGNSYINRPNAFTFSGVYQPTTHFSNRFLNGLVANNNLAVLVNASSGDQQNEVTGSNLNGDAQSVGQQRPLFVGRNTLRGPNIYQADARFTRTFATFFERVKPQIFVEANNFFNRSNFTVINTTATTNAAGAITAAPSLVPTSSVLEARILQFGARDRLLAASLRSHGGETRSHRPSCQHRMRPILTDDQQASAFPASVYREQVLTHIFSDAQRLFLDTLLEIDRAHLVMLHAQGIVSAPTASACARALNALDSAALRNAPYDGSVEDLFFLVERELAAIAGDEDAGRLHTARSRNDIDLTMYRMVLTD